MEYFFKGDVTMTNTKRSIIAEGFSTKSFIYLVLSVGMLVTSIYLTKHFYQTYFPQGLADTSSICNINEFWGCDKATKSALGSIFGVPTSFFGVFIGLLGIISLFFSSEKVERTNKLFITLNAAGCLILLAYSLIALKSLCPLCSVYYLFSFITFYFFHKYSDYKAGFELKPFAAYTLLLLLPALYLSSDFSNRVKAQSSLNTAYIGEFKKLNDYGDPTIESPYKIYKSTENFADAPIRLSVFSDFQCPFCKIVSDQMPQIIEEFKGKINIQYMFYPLDGSCNPNMQGGMHAYACMAAYLAACDERKFAKVHDYIFANQEKITATSLKDWARKFELNESCFTDKKLEGIVSQTISTGEQYKLKSTPTIIINGRKLEGSLPTVHLKAILRSLLDNEL